MAKISDALVSSFAKAVSPKQKKSNVSYIFGVARNNANKTISVKIDGDASNTYQVIKSSVRVTDGDRVAVMIKNRVGLITSNISKPTLNNSASVGSASIQTAGATTYETNYSISLGAASGSGTESEFTTTSSTEVITSPTRDVLKAELFTDDAYDIIKMGVDRSGEYVYDSATGTYVELVTKTQLQVPMIKTQNLLNTSDRRLKRDIADTDETDALGKINKIRHRKYAWKSGGGRVDIGYIAEEMGQIDPGLEVSYGESNSVNMSYLIPLMSKAIQELSLEVDNLRKEVNKLNEQIKHNRLSAEE